ncbi:hypothetical protein OEZ84_26455, partial [Leclercia adecarboxylata]|uniref:hypothetical protein n=1 Tax=Leclercia adecarboxylata TaxID=83655 RepID=UPI00234D56E0
MELLLIDILLMKLHYLANMTQNPMLPAALSTEERKWYDRIKLHILSSKREYYCSWWLRLDYEDVEKDLS